MASTAPTIAIDARELTASTGRYVERLIHYLQEIDQTHKYIILLNPGDFANWQPTNKNFKKVVCPYKEFTFDEQIALKDQLIQLQPDLVHFAMIQQPVLYKGKVVTTIHDLTTARFRNPSKNPAVFITKQQVYKWVIKRVAHKSNAIITPTEYVKEDIAKFARINSRKITVTYESADPILEKPEPLHKLENEDFIMFVGRPQPHKNLYRLIAAFNLLQQSKPGLKLVLAGKTDPTYIQVEQWVTDQAIKNVIFTGFVSEAQLKWLYLNCRAYIFPSLSEGFGLPGLEAMCHGAPVVSSNLTSLPEIYGDAALYFDPLDVDDMKTKILEVLNNSKLRDGLIEKGKNQIKKYSWQKMAEQTLKIYETVLEN